MKINEIVNSEESKILSWSDCNHLSMLSSNKQGLKTAD